MKKTVFFSLLVLTFLSLESCKKGEESKEGAEAATAEPKIEFKENFNLQIVASAAQKDDFAVYFTEDNTINFNEKNAVWRSINGGNTDETINFEMTEDRIPTNIRLDFGLNKAQDSVVIKSVKVNYYANSFEFKGSDFFTYFNKDEQFKYNINPANGTLTLYKKDGEYKTPFFYPTQLTTDKVKEITTQKK